MTILGNLVEDTDASIHIGDGVYVSFDGYQIWLAVNHHDNKVVALEPPVFHRLTELGKDILETAFNNPDDSESPKET